MIQTPPAASILTYSARTVSRRRMPPPWQALKNFPTRYMHRQKRGFPPPSYSGTWVWGGAWSISPSFTLCPTYYCVWEDRSPRGMTSIFYWRELSPTGTFSEKLSDYKPEPCLFHSPHPVVCNNWCGTCSGPRLQPSLDIWSGQRRYGRRMGPGNHIPSYAVRRHLPGGWTHAHGGLYPSLGINSQCRSGGWLSSTDRLAPGGPHP